MKKRLYPALIVAASFITTPSFAGGGNETDSFGESEILSAEEILQRLKQCTQDNIEDVKHNAYLNGEKDISEQEVKDRAKNRCMMLDPDWSRSKKIHSTLD